MDERAKRVFMSALPDNWFTNELTPDKDHLDYRVVVLDGYKPTGIDFYVQLKGVGTKASRRPLRFSFRKNQVEYWLDRQRRPVFVVLVDTDSRVAFWESIQRWSASAGNGWRARNRSSVTVKTPIANTLTAFDGIVAAVHEAEELLRRKHAPSPMDRRAELQAMDERFTVEVRATDQRTQFVFHATKPVKFEIGARNAAGREKLRDAIELGEDATFAPGELQFVGGGIFDEMTRVATHAEVVISTQARMDCEFSLGSVDQKGRYTTGIFGIRGQLVGGLKRRRYFADLGNGLVAVSGVLRLEPPNAIAVQYQLLVNTAPWTGVRVRELPYFDRIWDFFNEAIDAAELRLDMHILEHTLKETIPAAIWRSLILGVGSRLQFLYHARTIAKRFALNPPLPDLDTLTQKDAEDLAVLYSVVQAGQATHSFSIGAISGTAPVSDESLKSVPTDWFENPTVMLKERVPASLFGQTSDRFFLRCEYHGVTLTQQSIEFLKQAKITGHLSQPLRLAASPECTMSVTIEEEEDSQAP